MEIHNIYHDNRTELIGRYCNSSTPGPTESVRGARGFRVILHTDEKYVASGFKAHYIYFNAKELFGGRTGVRKVAYKSALGARNF